MRVHACVHIHANAHTCARKLCMGGKRASAHALSRSTLGALHLPKKLRKPHQYYFGRGTQCTSFACRAANDGRRGLGINFSSAKEHLLKGSFEELLHGPGGQEGARRLLHHTFVPNSTSKSLAKEPYLGSRFSLSDDDIVARRGGQIAGAYSNHVGTDLRADRGLASWRTWDQFWFPREQAALLRESERSVTEPSVDGGENHNELQGAWNEQKSWVRVGWQALRGLTWLHGGPKLGASIRRQGAERHGRALADVPGQVAASTVSAPNFWSVQGINVTELLRMLVAGLRVSGSSPGAPGGARSEVQSPVPPPRALSSGNFQSPRVSRSSVLAQGDGAEGPKTDGPRDTGTAPPKGPPRQSPRPPEPPEPEDDRPSPPPPRSSPPPSPTPAKTEDADASAGDREVEYLAGAKLAVDA